MRHTHWDYQYKTLVNIPKNGACAFPFLSHSSQNYAEYPQNLVVFKTNCIFAVEKRRLVGKQSNLMRR